MITLMDWLVQLEYRRTLLNRTGQVRLEQLALSKSKVRKAEKKAGVQSGARPVGVPAPCCQGSAL